jgi:DMSO/TMAO reductase YedYZ heme-binding membrane subunit
MNDTLLWYTTRGAGVVTLLMLTGVAVLGVVTSLRLAPGSWPRFMVGGLHRNLALLAVTFLGVHIVTAVVDPFTHLGWAAALVPFSSYYRTFWLGLGAIAAELLAAVVLSSLLRRVLGFGTWRAIHWLAYLAWPVAVVHGLGTGTDSGSGWLRALDALCAGVVLVALAARLFLGSRDPLGAARTGFRTAVERPLQQ